MKQELIKAIAYIVPFMLVSTIQAAEFSHTARTTLCQLTRQAHGQCISTHSGGVAKSINFNCKLKKDGVTKASEIKTFTSLEGSSRFTATLHTSLTGSSFGWYCTHNTSRYQNLFGVNIANQGDTAQDCTPYSRSRGGYKEP